MAITEKPKTQTQIIADIAEITQSSKKVVKEIISQYESSLLVELVTKQVVKVGILGKMKIRIRQTRVGVNPQTGDKVVVPGKAVPKFLFSKGVKEVIDEQLSDSLDIHEDPNAIENKYEIEDIE